MCLIWFYVHVTSFWFTLDVLIVNIAEGKYMSKPRENDLSFLLDFFDLLNKCIPSLSVSYMVPRQINLLLTCPVSEEFTIISMSVFTKQSHVIDAEADRADNPRRETVVAEHSLDDLRDKPC